MNRKPLLLPTYFKWIGAAALVFMLLLMIISKEVFDVNFTKIIWAKLIVKTIVAISCFFFISSKEKIEDEFIMQCRYKALAGCLYSCLFFSVYGELTQHYFPFLFLPLFKSVFCISCQQALLYAITFNLLKRGKA